MADRKDDIEGYHKGTLSERERHALEKKALNDPFLAEALEGSESISSEDFSADLIELSKKIERGRSAWFTPLRIAASVLFLVGAGAFFYYFTLREPVTFALEKSASTGPSADSISTPRKDSSGFLTLAKPDDTEKERRKEQELSSSRSASKVPARQVRRIPPGKHPPLLEQVQKHSPHPSKLIRIRTQWRRLR